MVAEYIPPGASQPSGQWIYGDGSDGSLTVANERAVSDGVTSANSPIVTSETADFTDDDLGQVISDGGVNLKFGTRIVSRQSSTQVTVDLTATNDSSGTDLTIGGRIAGGRNYMTVTIPEGVTAKFEQVLNLAGNWFFCCSDSFVIDGILDLSGVDGVGMNGGGGLLVNQPGGPGSQFDASSTQGQAASASGDSGAGASGVGMPRVPAIPPGLARQAAVIQSQAAYYGGAGGPGGAGDGTNFGGGGGGGGSFVLVIARHIVHGNDNLYILKGGDAGEAGDDGTGDTGNGDCGGGAGGGNGWWMTLSDDIAGDANIDNSLGAGSPGCGAGIDGTDGESGFAVHLLNVAS